MNWLSDLWKKIRADVTNAVALISTGLGSAMAHIDDIATTLGDPSLNQQLTTVANDAKWIGRWMLLVGVLTALARFKKLVQTPKA